MSLMYKNNDIDYREHVSRGDLHYEKTVKRCEGGLPIGNGRMGSLAWTSPSAIKFQINRVDVYASDCSSNTFNYRHMDYAYACGFVDIDFVDYGEDVFTDDGIQQHLSLYDAIASIKGRSVSAEMFACDSGDVFAVRVEDSRESAQTINVRLKMLRPAEVVTKQHSAISTLSMVKDMIVLKQEFREGNYYCSSAVVVGISGRDSVARMNDEAGGRVPACSFRKTRVLGQPNETEMRLCMRPGKGSFDIFIGSAATFDEKEDVVAKAVREVEASRNSGYDGLLKEHKEWWNKFWVKSYIRLGSEDGSAEFVEAHYTYFLYIMASSSRGGKYPPNFGGMLWSPRGDLRHWGAMQWWNNLNLYYNAILPSGHKELLYPYFDMYTGMYDSCARAAEQQWGTKGIWIPETCRFNGLDELPEDIAAEMRDLYLVRKPWEERSERFKEYACSKHPHESRWNWKGFEAWADGKLTYQDRGFGAFGPVTHMFGSQAGVAYLFWLYYEYTRDENWLRERAYPMIKGVAEFFRNFPNVRKEEDGKYHIYYTNNGEGFFGGKDSMESLGAMYGILPVLMKASEILDIDEDMRPVWREFYDNLAPLPMSDSPESVLKTKDGETPVWVGAFEPIRDDRREVSLNPCRYFDLCTLETAYDDPETFKTAEATIKYHLAVHGIDGRRTVSEMSSFARMVAGMGLAQEFKQVVISQLECINADKEYCYFDDTGRVKVFENRMTVREGVNAMSAQRLGNAAYGLQYALCQSQGAGPGKEPVIRLFGAWPEEWDAEFKLSCRGGFVVTAAIYKGVIEYVNIESTLGGKCRLRNPWGEKEVSLYMDGRNIMALNGSLLEFDTVKGGKVSVHSLR